MDYNEIINGNAVVLVEFYASWCHHCRHMMPVVEQVKELLEGNAQVYQFDIDENKSLASREHVDTIPAFIIYKDGREVWRHAGEMDGETLLHQVESYV